MVILFLLIMLIVFRQYWKRLAIILGCFILIFNIGFQTIAYNAMHVGSVGPKQNLSVPLQQTVRYFRDYQGTISDFEYDAVNRVLPIDSIIEKQLYNPGKSDPVKARFKEDATKEDLQNYFIAWGYGFKKAPLIYLKAFIQLNYKYLSVIPADGNINYWETHPISCIYERGKHWYDKLGYSKEDFLPLDYSSPEYLEEARNAMKDYSLTVYSLPVFGELFSIGASFWLLIWMIVFCLRKKKRLNLLYLMLPTFIMIACLFTPVNGNIRYAFPVMMVVPFLFAITCVPQNNKDGDSGKTERGGSGRMKTS